MNSVFFALTLAAVAFATNPKSRYTQKLMRNAIPTSNSQLRRLDEAEDDFDVDLSPYSLKFMKCQFVRSFDDELAEDADSDSVLAVKRFVIFRMCPDSSCSSCNYGYGEYLVEMEDYLDAMVQYRQEEQEEYCQNCDEMCEEEEGDDAAGEGNGDRRRLGDCDTCQETCEKIENMEENGYIDATDFVNCQEIYQGDDDGSSLYAGAMCASNGSKIKIGVFSDEECNTLTDKDIEDYLADDDGNQAHLSHALLKTTYDTENCIDCLVEDEEDEEQGDDANAEEKEAETKEVCDQLYEASAKCEAVHGFDGISDYYQYYSVQASNEEIVCDYIQSLKSGTYDSSGEIVIGGSVSYAEGGTGTTGGQKFFLTFFILGTVGLAVYAAMLHSQLTKNAKADLSAQGGAMA